MLNKFFDWLYLIISGSGETHMEYLKLKEQNRKIDKIFDYYNIKKPE